MACGQCRVRCDNNQVSCGAWAGRGECRQNPEYMEIYCSKACTTCTKGQKKSCKDLKSGVWCYIIDLNISTTMVHVLSFFRLSHMGTEGLLQDWILCQLYEEKLQENMQTVLTFYLNTHEYLL